MKFLAGAATNARPHPHLRFLLPEAHLWVPAKDERRGKAMKGVGSEPMRALRDAPGYRAVRVPRREKFPTGRGAPWKNDS